VSSYGTTRSGRSLPGDLLGAKEIREIAEQLQVRPTKQLGQNFVIDPNTIDRIIRVADVSPSDVVLEVGPGLGSLTLGLLPNVRAVIAVEIDDRLASQLPMTVARHAPRFNDRLTVIRANALDAFDTDQAPTALVANLPYNISVPVLLHLLRTIPTLERALVMVQREVGERLAAHPGSKTYGVPSVKAQWFGDVRLVGTVPRSVFWPEPNVDSVLVRLDRKPEPQSTVGREQVFALVDQGFGQRRKMLRSALGEWGRARVEDALRSVGLPETIRGEECSVTDFIRLADALADAQ
jgi:16S rRNA (adenine1518-N6/adenine1519-N6)-dimethyltransferase